MSQGLRKQAPKIAGSLSPVPEPWLREIDLLGLPPGWTVIGGSDETVPGVWSIALGHESALAAVVNGRIKPPGRGDPGCMPGFVHGYAESRRSALAEAIRLTSEHPPKPEWRQ